MIACQSCRTQPMQQLLACQTLRVELPLPFCLRLENAVQLPVAVVEQEYGHSAHADACICQLKFTLLNGSSRQAKREPSLKL